MTPKQRWFIDEGLVDLDATQAAIRARYSARTARLIATENLTKPVVAAAIAQAQAERAERTEVTQDRVLREVAALALLGPAALYDRDGVLLPIHEMPLAACVCIAGIDGGEERDSEGNLMGTVRKLKLTDKLGALSLLAHHLGRLNDKLPLKGEAEHPLVLLIKAIQGNSIKPVPTHSPPKPGEAS